jgi:hypothetical protein
MVKRSNICPPLTVWQQFNGSKYSNRIWSTGMYIYKIVKKFFISVPHFEESFGKAQAFLLIIK